MKYVLTAEEMKQYDNYTIDLLGIPTEVLMERAAVFSVEKMERYCHGMHILLEESKVLVVAGVGNNGGDGLAVARLLTDRGCNVSVVIIGEQTKMTPACTLQFQILEKYGIPVCDVFPNDEYDIIVDALFGIGLSREVTGIYAETINQINASNGMVFSLDIPSGIDTDTGRVLGTAVKADATFTFSYLKRGLLFYPGAEYSGSISIGNIGITDRSFSGNPPEMFTFRESEWQSFHEKRTESGNKGSFGKVFMLCGSKDMAGAAILASKACYRSGVGMVKVATPEENRIIIQETIPETMLLTYSNDDENNSEFDKKFKESIKWADVLLAGPGLGKQPIAKQLLSKMICDTQKTLVLDADALNLLSGDENLKSALKESILRSDRKVVMTPHVGELSRLIKWNVSEIKNDFVGAAKKAVEEYGCIVVCKDARTLVCGPGREIYLNTVGNSGMATAGTGDILAGMVSAFCCIKGDCFNKVISAVYLHSMIGRIVSFHKSKESMMASDLIDALSNLFNTMTEED